MFFIYLIVLYNQVSGKVEEPDQETFSSSSELNSTAVLFHIFMQNSSKNHRSALGAILNLQGGVAESASLGSVGNSVHRIRSSISLSRCFLIENNTPWFY